MTSLNHQLWELISTHPMPDDTRGRSFTEQLMAEHRIRRETALTAIEEYRKFIYLCATRTARNVPSKAVDLVWHLHMQHSRDYWDVFCRKLGKPIHHAPGGAGHGHLDDYKKTVAAYRSLFGRPPKGVWRQTSRIATVVGLVFVSLFVAVGLTLLAQPEVPKAFAVLFTAFSLFALYRVAQTMTPKGQHELTFELGDPFADEDAGDCGSGDGGGCGD